LGIEYIECDLPTFFGASGQLGTKWRTIASPTQVNNGQKIAYMAVGVSDDLSCIQIEIETVAASWITRSNDLVMCSGNIVSVRKDLQYVIEAKGGSALWRGAVLLR
jgi:hypothetical protein